MLPHQQRVIDEKKQLDEKLAKLYSFLATDGFRALDRSEQGRLTSQYVVMGEYSEILDDRIKAFSEAT